MSIQKVWEENRRQGQKDGKNGRQMKTGFEKTEGVVGEEKT